jgi:hypothetical protein
MLTLMDLVWAALFVLLLNHWWRSRDAKAFALQYAAKRCQELDLQLLDQSMVLKKIRLRRGSDGLHWHRRYEFEFSSTGTERYPGSVELAGNRLLGIEMAAHVTYH